MSHFRLATFAFSLSGSGLFVQNSIQPNNSAVNQQNRQTADQQKQGLTDRTLTQQIRKAVVKDKSLPTYAHNVKSVAQNRIVMLRGPERSEEEKRNVEVKAAEIAGRGNVRNEISVANSFDSKLSKRGLMAYGGK